MWEPLLRPGFLLVDAPAAVQEDLVQGLVHEALRSSPHDVLVYDSSHAFHPDSFAAENRRRLRPPAEHATRCLVQRALTPFQWDTLLSKGLDRMLSERPLALVAAFPYGRLFATDELAEWERIDHLEFSLAHLRRRGERLPIVAVTDLVQLAAEQPVLAHAMRSGAPRLATVRRHRGAWSLHGDGAPAAHKPFEPRLDVAA